jgi:two-component system chemotaxis sensor kinase CheA
MSVDIAQFHQTFFEESFEGLDAMESALLGLDIGAADAETINGIFRAAHSIKGGSATFGFSAVANFTHRVETLLDQMREGSRPVTQDAVEILLQSVDVLRAMLEAVRGDGALPDAMAAEVQGRLETMLATDEGGTAESADGPQAADGEGWRIVFQPHQHMLQTGNDPIRIFRELAELGELEVRADTSKLPSLTELDPEACHLGWTLELRGEASEGDVREVFDWVEGDCDLAIEPLGRVEGGGDVVPVAAQAAPADKPAAQARSSAGEGGSIRVDIAKVDAIINLVGELVITQSMLGQVGESMEDSPGLDLQRFEKLRDGLAQLERNTRELQESVMQIRMLPISFAFNRFPRLVRDLSQQLGKRIELKMFGEQTELDKTVMEKIGDPLVHLVRNALDHGIEAPAARLEMGKPESGVVELEAYHKGGNIIIEIRDDGRGLDRDKLLAKARGRGLVPDGQVPSDADIYEYVFHPGFSTADKVSDVSGRGVGMDVVRRNIKALGGNVEIHTEKGRGTTFTVRLPLTLSILDGQLVRVGDQSYVIPLVSIVESLQIRQRQVSAIAGKAEMYKLRDDYIPIVRLNEVFGSGSPYSTLEGGLMVVAEGDGNRAGFMVDDLLGQQQVVIKSLETNFQRVEGLSGATILGDGTVALILDVAGLIQRFRHGDPSINASSGPRADQHNAAA